MKKLLLFCAAWFVALSSFSQKFSFVSYSTKEGLPQSQVTAISQDEDGYLWIGTIGGLSKFNGGEFVSYTSKEGLLNNRITSLDYFDRTVWVGHDGGISFIRNKTIKSIAFTGEDKSRPVLKILRFKERLLVCSNGGGLFELKGDKLVKIELGKSNYDRIRSGYIYNDVLHLATREGILVTKDLQQFSILEELGNHSFSGIAGNDDQIIFTTYDSLLIRKRLSNNSIEFLNPEKIRSIYGCYLGGDNTTWLFSKDGVVRLTEEGEAFLLNESSGLPLNAISCIFQDRNDNLWIGSQGKGIFRFPGLSFKYYDQSSGYLSDLFVTGFQKTNGEYYFGTFDKGILKREPNGRMSVVDIGKNYVSVWAAIKNVDGKDWFGTQVSLVSVTPEGHVEVLNNESHNIPGSKIVSFERISDNSMYIGGNEGVALYRNGVFKKLGKRDSEYLGTVRDMEVYDGVLYCASNLGLFKYTNGNFFPVSELDQVLYNLIADDHGNLWIGAEGGLYRMRDGEITQIKLLNDDPRANSINFLNIRNDELYVGTNNGLFVVSNLEGDYFIKRYGVGDGIPDLETNLNSSFFDNEGSFWFGTSSGLVCFHKDVHGIGTTKPGIFLKSILLNYQQFDYSNYSEKLDGNGLPEQLVLPYSKNNLIFELDGISLVNHKTLKYQFWLEGLNEGWSPLSSISTITFTNLPAGDYVLRVRAVDIDGRTSGEISLPFIINEAYYKTWWFILLCGLVAGSVILLIFRSRVKRIRELNEREKLVYKTRLLALEQKSVNASMNRHFIFNALNSIQYFINTRDRVSANKYLTNFAQLIRKNLDSATSEDNMITLEEEVSRIRLYLSLESMRFKDRFEYEIDTDSVDLESIKIPAMIMQPFIENSIIHGILPNESVKGMIRILIRLKGNFLEISIEDNGVGVKQSISNKSNYEGDHKSQGMEITSKRIELIKKISDQNMELIGPEEIIDKDGSIKGTYVLIKIPVENLDN